MASSGRSLRSTSRSSSRSNSDRLEDIQTSLNRISQTIDRPDRSVIIANSNTDEDIDEIETDEYEIVRDGEVTDRERRRLQERNRESDEESDESFRRLAHGESVVVAIPNTEEMA